MNRCDGPPIELPEDDGCVIDRLHGMLDAYERPIYAFLLGLVRDPDLALDCVQETFLRAHVNLRRNRPVNAGWLYRVAHNLAMDEFRRARRMIRDPEALQDVPAGGPLVDDVVDVQGVVARMSPSHRQVLYLYVVAGFATEEIGAMLGIRGRAVRQRLYRARQRFRQLWNATPESPAV